MITKLTILYFYMQFWAFVNIKLYSASGLQQSAFALKSIKPQIEFLSLGYIFYSERVWDRDKHVFYLNWKIESPNYMVLDHKFVWTDISATYNPFVCIKSKAARSTTQTRVLPQERANLISPLVNTMSRRTSRKWQSGHVLEGRVCVMSEKEDSARNLPTRMFLRLKYCLKNLYEYQHKSLCDGKRSLYVMIEQVLMWLYTKSLRDGKSTVTTSLVVIVQWFLRVGRTRLYVKVKQVCL